MTSISEITRRNVIDTLILDQVKWSGRLGETEFLARLFDLTVLPSKDGRFSDAAGDIWQHRINNYDWDDNWVFYDDRLDLLHGPDEVFLRFLCEMIHPIVRPDAEEAIGLVQLFNDYLKEDGWEIVAGTRLSGRSVYKARQRLEGVPGVASATQVVMTALDADYVSQQITRMEAAVENDPALAIGTAKEFVETVCKTILSERSVEYTKHDDVPRLVRLTAKSLQLVPDDIPDTAKASDTIRVLLSNLATVANGIAEIRNPYGTGHGKEARFKGLKPRHARLAVGAATALGVFLYETHLERPAIL